MNTFGRLLRITTWGESHGVGLGAVIDGLPAGLTLSEEHIQPQLDRRRPGQSALTTPRAEKDTVKIMSGVFDGVTTGTPVSLAFWNHDVDSSKYEDLKTLYRPSHADYTYEAKYGVRDWRGGGRASARETAARVAAGAIAERWLAEEHGLEIIAWVSDVGAEHSDVDEALVTREQVDTADVRCPDADAAARMDALIRDARRDKDSVGGCIRCVVRGVPAGWGEPLFAKLEGELAGAMLSIPATKGFEIGSGFGGTLLRGSQHNDAFQMDGDNVRTLTNRSGGVQGGISNGEHVSFRVAFKPVATIFQAQQTVTAEGEDTTFAARGRHDPCVLPRAVPIVEAMAALVLMDAALSQQARRRLG
ncbi:MAG: chorismate synthase [Bradymonadia bacterium]|jgi:chorismate synthase